MNTLAKISLHSMGASALALGLITPNVAMAESGDSASANGHSIVHRVTHSLANADSYSNSSGGYKWGRKTESNADTSSKWADSTPARGGYKWGNSPAAKSGAHSYAGTTSYRWNSMGFVEQSRYKWGVRNYAEQARYKWGVRNYAEQARYKWGVR
jgi:hypothetical protein